MIQKPPTIAEHQRDFLVGLAQTGIRQLAPGGKARAFCDIVADKLGQLEARQFANLGQTLLPFATGDALDLIGEIYGVTRIGQSNARVENTEQNFEFYVRRGTFGDINGGQNIVIPADVRITTLAESGPVYLTNPIVLQANNSRQFFSARSLYPGSSGNAAAQLLARHNFTGYRDAAFGSLLVTNNFGIVTGRDEETDDSYRYRIYLKIRSNSGANEAALRFELLRIPGVQNVVFVPESGRFQVYVYSISPYTSPALIDAVQTVLNQKAAFPLTGIALSPDLVGISLATSLKVSNSYSATDQEIIVSNARSAAEQYINNLRIDEPLVINEIADRMRASDSRISDVGQPNRPIEEILIWRSRSNDTRYSRFLAANYTPALGERIVVENRLNAIALEVTT